MTRLRWLSLVVSGAVALAIRSWHVTTDPLWADELHVAMAARLGVGAAIRGAASDVQPPLFYALMGVLHPLIQPDIALRWVSVVFGVATVVLVAHVAARLSGAWASWVAGLWLALLPAHVHWSQELRSYSLAGLLFVAASSNIALGGSALVTAAIGGLLLYLHGLAPLLLVGLAAQSLLLRQFRHVGALGLSVLTFLPWATVTLEQTHRYSSWNQPGVPVDFLLGVARYAGFGHSDIAKVTLWSVVPIALALYGARTRMGQALVAAVILPVLGMAVAVVRVGDLMPKHAMMVLPAFGLAIAVGLAGQRLAVRAVVGLACLVGPLVGLRSGAARLPVRFDLDGALRDGMAVRGGVGPVFSAMLDDVRFLGVADAAGMPSPWDQTAFDESASWQLGAYANRTPIVWWFADGPSAGALRERATKYSVVWQTEHAAAYGVAVEVQPGVAVPMASVSREGAGLENGDASLAFYSAGSARFAAPGTGTLVLWAVGSTIGALEPELEVEIGHRRVVCHASTRLRRLIVGDIAQGEEVVLRFVHDEATADGDLNVWVHRVEISGGGAPSLDAPCEPVPR